MKLLRLLRYLPIFLLIFLQPLNGQDQTRLKTTDISRIMQEIFVQHLDKKQIDSELTKNAVRLYIDSFDPSHIYLLDSEVSPFLNESNANWQKITRQLQQQDYSIFSQLDELFQNAIYRARNLRHLTIPEFTKLFHQAANQRTDDEKSSPDISRVFIADEGLLQQGWRERFVDYIRAEIEQSSVAHLQNKQQQMLDQFETNMREMEAPYLYLNTEGVALSPAEKQHYFSLHILKALSSALDPHTAFFDDAEAFEMKAHLDKGFEGVGIIFFQDPDGFIINEILPNSPAAANGLIQVKDQILAINGEKLNGKSIEEVMELMRGQHDQPLSLLLKHPSQNNEKLDPIVEVRLTPQKITLNNDRTEWGYAPYQKGILGWVTLHSFYEGSNAVSSSKDVQNAIEELKKQGKLVGLVLDLRDNGGGYLTQAVKVVSLFINDGVVVVSKYNDGSKHIYRDIAGPATYSGPLIVLTSRLTASAAEIVAQALQDYGVALVVGDDRTFGKGTIQAQTVTDSNSTSYFKVTVGRYYTVSGKTAQLTGVKSDIEVPGPYEHLHVGEVYLKEALPNDQIEPEYIDKLEDIDPFVHDWYLRYYVPSIQHQVTQWKSLTPNLKLLSAQRLKANKTYQRFIQDIRNQYRISTIKSWMNHQEKINGGEDPQLTEALNILKDMNSLSRPSLAETKMPLNGR